MVTVRTRRPSERGFILITMALAAVAVMGAVGLAIDLGRVFIAKSEVQAFCDTSALAATLKLDGTSLGITNATAAVSSSANYYNFDSSTISNYTVTFAKTVAGPWVATPGTPAGYIYTKVTATVPVALYFIPTVVSQTSQSVPAYAIAGQISQTSLKRGLGPFTAVASDTTSATYGFTVGGYYDIQWPAYNGTRAGCGTNNPDKCFVQPPCADEPKAAEAKIVQYWGASTNGFWGSNSNSTIDQEVLDAIQLAPVSIGDAISLTSGNKNSEATALDTRVNQDLDLTDNVPANYLANANHNGRRILGVPIVNPTATGTYAVAYAAFLLVSNGASSNYYASGNGNDPFCAIYMGPYSQGSGVGGGTNGYTIVKLVQ